MKIILATILLLCLTSCQHSQFKNRGKGKGFNPLHVEKGYWHQSNFGPTYIRTF